MWKHKAHAAINVLGLTVGLASCLIIFLITHFELGYDHFHPNGDRIYRIVTHEGQPNQQSNIGSVPGPLPPALRKELTGFQAVSAFVNVDSKVIIPGKGADQPAKELEQPSEGTPSPIIITDPQYFQIFHYKWLAGNPATSLNDPYRVVLSASELKQYFGAIPPREAVGREVFYPGLDSLRTYVSGVVQDWDQRTDFGFRDFISYSTVESTNLKRNYHLNNWGGICDCSQGFVLLPDGKTPAQVERQFPAFVSPPYTASRGSPAFVLLLAVISFVELSTAQSLQRTKRSASERFWAACARTSPLQFLGETFVARSRSGDRLAAHHIRRRSPLLQQLDAARPPSGALYLHPALPGRHQSP